MANIRPKEQKEPSNRFLRAVKLLGWRDTILGFPNIAAYACVIFSIYLSSQYGIDSFIKYYYGVSDVLILVPTAILGVILALIGIAFGFFSDTVVEKIRQKKSKLHQVLGAVFEIVLNFQVISIIILFIQIVISKYNIVSSILDSSVYSGFLFVWIIFSVYCVSYAVFSVFNLIVMLVDLLNIRVDMK